MNKSPIKSIPSRSIKEFSLTDIMNALTSMRKEIQSINSKLSTQENTSTAILNKIDALTSEIVSLKKENEELKKDIDTLKKYNNNIHTENAPNDHSGLDIVREIHDRDIKSRNIIIFNMNESVSDIDSLAVELIKNLHIDATISAVSQLGKQSTKPRPIRIIFDSSKSVIDVLKSKKSLSTLPMWSNVWITTDLTFYQMKILQSLKAERDRRNSSDNGNWFIKYICGSPTLAQKNKFTAQVHLSIKHHVIFQIIYMLIIISTSLKTLILYLGFTRMSEV